MKRYLLAFFFMTFFYSTNAQLNLSINIEGCGIKYIHKAMKVANRAQGSDGPGNLLPVTFSINELPEPCYEIVGAYVWSVVSYSAGSPDPATVTVLNSINASSTHVSTKIGENIPKCWSEIGTRTFRTDITNSISGNGAYDISINTGNNETDGITLIIVYKDLKSKDEGHLHLRDGLITVGASGAATINTISGFNVCESKNDAVGFVIAADIQLTSIPSTTFNTTINGTLYSLPRRFWNSEALLIPVTSGQTTMGFNIDPAGLDCYSIAMEGFYYSSSTCKTCSGGEIPAKATADKKIACYDDVIQLDVNSAQSYKWTSSPAGFSSTLKNPKVNLQQSTKFYVSIYELNGCLTGIDSVIVNMYPRLQITKLTDVSICIGSSIPLQPIITQTATPYTFKWSPATGLDNPNIQNVIANPTKTTVYNLTVSDGNGCSNSKSITITVNPLPIANAGRDTAICKGDNITLNAKASAGTQPFSYDWNPKSQIISGANTLSPTITLNSSSDFYLTVTDINGCIDIDTIYIKANPLPQPVITPSGPTRFCSCDSITLDAGNLGYISYKWNTGATTQRIIVKTAGSFTVTVTDTNGCINTSAPLVTQIITPTSTVGFESSQYQANSGDIVNMPFVIKSSSYLDTCHSFNYTAQIRFNKSLISPTLNTPKGTKTVNERIIKFSGVRKPNDSVLSIFNFIATLGDSAQTNVTVENFVWNDCLFATNTVNSIFTLTDICKAGNVSRFILQAKSASIISVVPNPVGSMGKITYQLESDTHLTMYISDILGNKILNLEDGNGKAGIFMKEVDMTNLNSGTYIIVLKTDTETISKMIEVSK